MVKVEDLRREAKKILKEGKVIMTERGFTQIRRITMGQRM